MKTLIIAALCLLASRVNAQNLSLEQIIAVRNLVDLPAINNYLSQRGWEFSEASPGDSIDQVVWLHHTLKDENDGIFNVMFCNLGENGYCDKSYVHSTGGNQQHAITIIYQPSRSTFLLIKKQAEAKGMALKTSLHSGSLHYIYTGARYQLRLAETQHEDGSKWYIVDLTHRRPND